MFLDKRNGPGLDAFKSKQVYRYCVGHSQPGQPEPGSLCLCAA